MPKLPEPATTASRFAGLLFWALAAAIAFATLCPIGLRPRTGHVVFERFVAYLLLGAAAAAAHPRAPLRDLLSVAGIAAALEAAQLLVPGRDGHVPDALEKIAGGAAGVLLVFALRGLAGLLRPRRPAGGPLSEAAAGR